MLLYLFFANFGHSISSGIANPFFATFIDTAHFVSFLLNGMRNFHMLLKKETMG